MRTLWKGAISFGLVTIPVSLYPATRKEELKFRMLRKSDLSPINYKRVAEADGKEVPWEEIVKGYEHEKGKYVILKEEDFARVDVEATQTVDIINFVKIDDVDPLLFYKPYYLEVGKGGDKAYVLLREALVGKRKDSIYEVGLRTGDWIKLKLLKEQEFVIGGYTEPEGTRQFFGSIIVGFYRGKKPIFAGKVGTGAPLTAGANGPRYYRFGDEALPLGGTPNGLSGQIRRVDAG